MAVGKDNATRPTIGVHRGSRITTLRCGENLRRARKDLVRDCRCTILRCGQRNCFCERSRRAASVSQVRRCRAIRACRRVNRFDPSRSVELAFVESQPLSEIARKTNKESINLYAELILRTLGRERGEMAALPAAVGQRARRRRSRAGCDSRLADARRNRDSVAWRFTMAQACRDSIW